MSEPLPNQLQCELNLRDVVCAEVMSPALGTPFPLGSKMELFVVGKKFAVEDIKKIGSELLYSLNGSLTKVFSTFLQYTASRSAYSVLLCANLRATLGRIRNADGVKGQLWLRPIPLLLPLQVSIISGVCERSVV